MPSVHIAIPIAIMHKTNKDPLHKLPFKGVTPQPSLASLRQVEFNKKLVLCSCNIFSSSFLRTSLTNARRQGNSFILPKFSVEINRC
jgi:hypothetical protein